MEEVQEKIIVYVDGSEPSWKAFNVALNHARKSRAKLYAIYVVDTDFLSGISSSQRGDVERDLTRAGALILAEAEKRASSVGVAMVKVLRKGNLQGEILKLAAEVNANYIYVAPKPKPSIVRKLLFGSVSDVLIKRAPCPVVVVK
ncbi:MAG: hypothetical protein DRJ62_03055 [Thermoprotei archaeon]|nr:MAG: hypothetical protein DRJ62_03055 [Thermoprotei archaeon]